MQRQQVSSTNVASIGYDSTSMTLEVEFTSGSVYQYFDVPEAIYREFINADSIGSFLHQNIKGNFRYTRI